MRGVGDHRRPGRIGAELGLAGQVVVAGEIEEAPFALGILLYEGLGVVDLLGIGVRGGPPAATEEVGEAPDPAGADAEDHEAEEKRNREPPVDDLDDAAALACAKVE